MKTATGLGLKPTLPHQEHSSDKVKVNHDVISKKGCGGGAENCRMKVTDGLVAVETSTEKVSRNLQDEGHRLFSCRSKEPKIVCKLPKLAVQGNREQN